MCCPFARRALIALLFVPGALAHSQAASDDSSTRFAFIRIGSNAEDRKRVAQIRGLERGNGTLIRTPSALADTTPISWREVRFAILPAYGDVTWNSTLPFSLNDGAQWAGRGLTATLSGGFTARVGRVHLNLTPQIWRTENRPVPVRPGGEPGRLGFSSPWHTGQRSADLPLRFGYRTTTAVDFGESAVWVTGYGAAAGLSSESQWWGPGLRNALLMSNNAGGIPHAFLRTAAPVHTKLGDVEGRWIIGGLLESRYFDFVNWNDLRSLSGAVVTLEPAIQRDVTIGVARVVFANANNIASLPGHALDALFWFPKRNAESPDPEDAGEQMTSLFGRWIFPRSGAEVYGEWTRILWPRSLRQFLVAPEYTQGFVVGLQWVVPRSPGPLYRAQLEFTNLEQAPPTKSANTVSFYTSPTIVQGYTQRGQVVGASIGPGSSSQWFALDRLTRDYDVGLFVSRVRWDTDSYYTQSTSIYYISYDASAFAGARASVRRRGRELAAELWMQRRYNYLYQNRLDGFEVRPMFDKSNTTLRFRIY